MAFSSIKLIFLSTTISSTLLVSILVDNLNSSAGSLIRWNENGGVRNAFRIKRKVGGGQPHPSLLSTHRTKIHSEDTKIPSGDAEINSEEHDVDFPGKWRPAEFYHLVLPNGYNKHTIPKHKSGRPIKVYIQVYIRKVHQLDETGESIEIDTAFRVSWTDYKIREYFNEKRKTMGLQSMSFDDLTPERKKNMTKTLNDPDMLAAIWKPNLYFGNLLKVSQPYPMSLPVQLKIIPDIGQFMYLTRISVQTDCPMRFHYYPADTQECLFSIQDFSYTEKDLELAWLKPGVWLSELEVSSFDVKVKQLEETSRFEDNEDALSDSFDVFTFKINSRRRLSYHVVQTYLPSTFYIIITCLCFLLPERLVEARIGIAMTTLLTLTSMFASVRESTPIVNYVKAIDVWMAGCIMFVFLVLGEFTFIIWLRSRTAETKIDDDGVDMERADFLRPKISSSHISYASSAKTIKYERLISFLEMYNFAIFTGLFLGCSVLYWAWLLYFSNYFDWTINPEHNNLDEIPW